MGQHPRQSKFSGTFAVILAVVVASVASAQLRAGACDPQNVPGLLAPLEPTPESLDVEAILDRPVELQWDMPDPDKRALLAEALLHYENPPGGAGGIFHLVYLARMAGHWFRNGMGYVAYRGDWTFAEKVRAVRAIVKRIAARTWLPDIRRSMWSAEEYATKDGSAVFAGAEHRLVLVNVPGVPMRKGFVPYEERRQIDRAGSPTKYYGAWDATQLADKIPWKEVRPDDAWDERLRPR